MILTPEQIEQCAVVDTDKTVMLSQYAHVYSTLLAYAEIVRWVAKTDPWKYEGYDREIPVCFFCDTASPWPHNADEIVHEPDCLYLAARKLRGLGVGE